MNYQKYGLYKLLWITDDNAYIFCFLPISTYLRSLMYLISISTSQEETINLQNLRWGSYKWGETCGARWRLSKNIYWKIGKGQKFWKVDNFDFFFERLLIGNNEIWILNFMGEEHLFQLHQDLWSHLNYNNSK